MDLARGSVFIKEIGLRPLTSFFSYNSQPRSSTWYLHPLSCTTNLNQLYHPSHINQQFLTGQQVQHLRTKSPQPHYNFIMSHLLIQDLHQQIENFANDLEEALEATRTEQQAHIELQHDLIAANEKLLKLQIDLRNALSQIESLQNEAPPSDAE